MIWRIRERAAFERLHRHGRRIPARSTPRRSSDESDRISVTPPTVWCTYLPDAAASPPRLAFAIGRAHGTAVHRNRLRRRLRAAIQALDRDALVPPGWYLVSARPTVNEQTFDALTSEVASLMDDARTIAGESAR